MRSGSGANACHVVVAAFGLGRSLTESGPQYQRSLLNYYLEVG